MYGKNAESLKVFIQKQGEDIPQKHVWKIAGNQGNFSHRATFDVDVINTAFRVRISFELPNTMIFLLSFVCLLQNNFHVQNNYFIQNNPLFQISDIKTDLLLLTDFLRQFYQ